MSEANSVAVDVYELHTNSIYSCSPVFCIQGDELKYQFVGRKKRGSYWDDWVYNHSEDSLVAFGKYTYKARGDKKYWVYAQKQLVNPDYWSTVKLGQDFAFRFNGKTIAFDCFTDPTEAKIEGNFQ